MAMTARSSTALDDILTDNAAGEISALDIRDFKTSVFVPQFSGAGVRRTGTDYAIPSSGVFTAIPWSVADFDTDSYWTAGDATKLTVPTSAYYRVTGAVHLETTGGSDSIAGIWIDGSDVNASQESLGRGEGGFIHHNGSYIANLTAGQYVQIVAYVNGALRDVRINARAWIQRVGQVPA